MPKTLQLFAYKGHLGSMADMDNGSFLNDLSNGQQLGVVVHSRDVEMTSEAKDVLRQARREGGSFAAIMLTAHADGSGSSLGVGGFGHMHFGPEEIAIGRDCDLSVLDDCETNDEIEVPQDFKDLVEQEK